METSHTSHNERATGTLIVHVNAAGTSKKPIGNALVTLKLTEPQGSDKKRGSTCPEWEARTGLDGRCVFDALPIGNYAVSCTAFTTLTATTDITPSCSAILCIEDPIGITITPKKVLDNCTLVPCSEGTVGRTTRLVAEIDNERKWENITDLAWHVSGTANIIPANARQQTMLVTPTQPGRINYRVRVSSLPIAGRGGISPAAMESEGEFTVEPAPIQPVSGELKTATTLTRTETSFTEDTAFWTSIRNTTEALSFNNYLNFMDWIFCGKPIPDEMSDFERERFTDKKNVWQDQLLKSRFLPFTDTDAYRVVKAATEAFVMVNCGVLKDGLQPFDPRRDDAYLNRRDLPVPRNGLQNVFNQDYLVKINGNGKILPYLAVIRRKLPDIPIKLAAFESATSNGQVDECYGLLQEKLVNPCLLELIWSYWLEEGGLVQTMNAITRRFQNVRSPGGQDPLANLEVDPLRPLNNLLWGYIQDEQHRLTLTRRNYEYDHHYGLRLEGKAVQNFRPADTRSKFLEGFHHLLRTCTVFYKQDDDTTVKADAFPVLNALKEVHLVLSQGAHNQFGDLPSTARVEMLIQEWFLARPEFREFLPTRLMVAYPEPWMDRVDAMKKLQGWTDTSVMHFRSLGVFGEQILLAIRWGHWSDEFEPVKALNWARFFRPQIQGYIHAYRAATGIDLSADPTVDTRVDSTLPSVLLKKRMASQQRAG